MPERNQYNFTRLIKDSDWDIISDDSSFCECNHRPFPSSGWGLATWFLIHYASPNNYQHASRHFSSKHIPFSLGYFPHRLFISVVSYRLFPQQHISLKEIFKTYWKFHSYTWWEPSILMLVTTHISYLCWNRPNLVKFWWVSSLNLITFCSASRSDT
jgi:hypothetical protein